MFRPLLIKFGTDKGLLAKLSQINIIEKVHDLFTSYLCKIQQIVVADGCKSFPVEGREGVTAGGLGAPTL